MNAHLIGILNLDMGNLRSVANATADAGRLEGPNLNRNPTM